MEQGKLVSWKTEKGYGFIAPDKGGPQVFVHISVLQSSVITPMAGEVVSYDAKLVDGRLRATRAKLASQKQHTSPQTQQRYLSLLIVLLFFGSLAYLADCRYIHMACVYLYLGASVFTFLLYAKDKWSAKSGRWRVAESSLQGLAFIGGWPGALLAQYFLRHKSSKQDFISVFLIMTIANLMVLGFYVYVVATGSMPDSLSDFERIL